MSFADVLAAARELTADERRELLRELAEPLSRESDDEMLRRLFPPGCTLDVWSPWDSHEAAVVMQQLLDERSAAK